MTYKGHLFEEQCSFTTERLSVYSVKQYVGTHENTDEFAQVILEILTPQVTQTLPENFQQINTLQSATDWVNTMLSESYFFIIQSLETKQIIGFIFLYDTKSKKTELELHLGYILGEKFWGKGYANEMMQGLLQWCEKSKLVFSLKGGVTPDNIASIKLLEKNNFKKLNTPRTQKETIFFEWKKK